ncbi:MAG: phosphate acyltransferase PlsX [Dehalococcoidales bacterium]|nr:phosphate acyltransferase PlsX [Dehalococcoidales bacterium]
MKIAVDAAGGEYAPHEIVKGAIKAARELEVEVILVGKRDMLYVQAGRHLTTLGLSIVDAGETIGFHESPVEAVQNKPCSSIVVGTNLVRDGIASAFVSAGHSGAVFYSALVSLGKVEGIDRPAIGSIINLNTTGPVLLVDAGANADCRPNHLVQFAQLGSIYARGIFGIDSPRIGLLNNGEEEGKGNRLAKESHQLLKKTSLNFIGNIEGYDITQGTVDVVVTDGFTGNIVLKTLEGLGDTFLKLRHVGRLLSRAYHLQGHDLLLDVGLGTLAKRMDYREYGGACLLGVKGNIIIAHGRSQATTIKNAIGLAKQTIERDITQKIKEEDYEQTHIRD